MRITTSPFVPALTLSLAAALLGGRAGAQFTNDPSKIPQGNPFNNSPTENVDFADVDLDGDWDVAMADGGDFGNDQNRIWINMGNLQAGTLGVFQDQTSTRFPSVLDDSRDIEFADIENDGDPDIYVSNTAQLSNQGNRWWVNQGLEQGGTLGFYLDDTANRWVGLGGAGSSIAPSQLIGGTFIDWSCDCDFGDLDNDGDLDLVHSTYGGSFGGQVPTRIFLNDGTGHFSEFNPSGFQLAGPTISPGNPGLWCEGTQSHNTTNSNGSLCDIAATPLDIDVMDIDGDLDLDILHGARNEFPRMFANRLDGSSLAPALGGGQMIFRDVTGAVFPGGYSTGVGHYEQEMGDMDGDGDVDLYGLNWQVGFGFNDVTMANDGSGHFGSLTVLTNSDDDDNEGDFFDYDNDGDVDLYIADFSGQDRLYRNNNNGGAGFSHTQVSLPNFSLISLDADCCDTDNDGDYDVLVAGDAFAANVFLRNTTQVPDTHAPYIPTMDVIGNRAATVDGVPARAQVYDNAPYYINWYNPTVIDLTVDGCALPSIQARSSAGQIFRGVIPGNLVGSVDYRFRSEDHYANSGTSVTKSYTSTYAGTMPATYGTGTAGTLGEPTIASLSVPFSGSDMYLVVGNTTPGSAVLMVVAGNKLPVPFQLNNLLLSNVLGPIYVSQIVVSDANGCAVLPIPIDVTIPPTSTFYAQGFAFPGVSDFFASSKGLEIVVQ